MKLPDPIAIALMIGFTICLGSPARAQTTPSPGSTVGPNQVSSLQNVALDPLTVSMTGDPMNRVGQPVFAVVLIKNASDRDLLLKNVDITIDGLSSERFTSQSKTCKLQQMGEISLSHGSSFQQSCRFDVKQRSIARRVAAFRDTLLAEDVRVAVTADIDQLGKYHYYPTFAVKAPDFSIFIGGMFGALLLSVFIWIQRVLTTPIVREEPLKDFAFTMLLGVRGGIMAVIALLLSTTTQSVGSPVSLTVVDFKGGIIIGLFSYPLASWISSVLKLDNIIVISDKKSENPVKVTT